MKEQTLEETKQIIQSKGLDKISSYFDLDITQLETMDSEILKNLYNMAKLGMQFEKEMNLTKRATEMNFIRVGKLITENREELKKYIRKSLPQYN